MVSTDIATPDPPADAEKPRRFRFPTEKGRHPTGRVQAFSYGCYFPQTDLVVTDMGGRGTGSPRWEGVEWLDG